MRKYNSYLKGIYWVLGVIVITVNSNVNAQVKPKKTFIEARIIDSNSGKPVVFANVLSSTRNWWAITDTLGIVKLPAREGDTITISSIGYFLSKYRISDFDIQNSLPVEIYLDEKVYELTKVDIYALGTYEDFKYKLLKMKIYDPLADLKNRINFEKDRLPSHPLQEGMSIPLGSPITAIYNLFSKEERSKRKLIEVKKSEDVIFFAESKYNRTLVARVTGLNDDLLDEFILKYRPSLDFLINASEYEVIGRIISDLELFKKELQEKEKPVEKDLNKKPENGKINGLS